MPRDLCTVYLFNVVVAARTHHPTGTVQLKSYVSY